MHGTPFPRARTLLQSFDAAKFQDPVSGDAYIAHARSEVLGAMLFGHEIVVPAGSIADSTAAIKLFSEVLDPGRDKLMKLRQRAGHDYSLFRVGLEPRFSKERRGFKGYDAFVENYIRSFKAGRNNFAALATLAEKSGATADIVLPLIGRAYLEGKWKAIEAVDPAFAHHLGHVVSLFSGRSSQGGPGIEPVYAKTNAFTFAPKTLYQKGMQGFAGLLKKRGIDYPGGDPLRLAIDAAQQDIANPGRRGEWYSQRERFGEHWSLVRIWLDQILHHRMIENYDISIPLLLQQPIEDAPVQRAAATIFLADRDFRRTVTGDGPREMTPSSLGSVPWKQMWEIVTAPEFQNSLNTMHRTSHRLRDEARRELEGVGRSALQQRSRITSNFREGVDAAVAEHVKFLNGASTRLSFRAGGDGLLEVRLGKRYRMGMTPKRQETAAKMLAIAADVGVSTATGNPPLVATLALTTADHVVFDHRIAKAINYAVKKISMVPEDAPAKAMLEREKKLVNLWISPC